MVVKKATMLCCNSTRFISFPRPFVLYGNKAVIAKSQSLAQVGIYSIKLFL